MIHQQIYSKINGKVEDEIRRTENTFLKALSSLSEKSLHGHITSMSAVTTPGEGNASLDQFESHGLESD